MRAGLVILFLMLCGFMLMLWGTQESPIVFVRDAEHDVHGPIFGMLLKDEVRVLKLRVQPCVSGTEHCIGNVFADVRVVGHLRYGVGALQCSLYTLGPVTQNFLQLERQSVLVGPKPVLVTMWFSSVDLLPRIRLGVHCSLDCCEKPQTIDATALVP